jgi:hypothetical protein
VIEVRRFFRRFVPLHKEYISRIEMLEKNVLSNEKRIKEIENIVFALKENVKKEKKERDIERKRKWLNGYPDETKGGKV